MENLTAIRNDFPILKRKVNGQPLVYFDNAATSQTPKKVIETIAHYYENYNAMQYIIYIYVHVRTGHGESELI